MKRHISDITALELEQVVKSIFPSVFDKKLTWSFNHDSVAKVIQYHTPRRKYEFLISYSDNTFSFHFIKHNKEYKIPPVKYNAVEIYFRELGFKVPKIEI